MTKLGDRGRLTTCLTSGFRCHPNYGNDLRRQYNQILHDMAKSDLLADLVSQLLGHRVSYTKFDDFADEILDADYTLS